MEIAHIGAFDRNTMKLDSYYVTMKNARLPEQEKRSILVYYQQQNPPRIKFKRFARKIT